MSGICRLIDDSGAVTYNFLDGSGLMVDDFSSGIVFAKNTITMTLFAASGAKSKADTLENLLQATVDHATDPVSANGMNFQIDGVDSSIVSALVTDFEMRRVSPNALQTFDWGYYSLVLVLLDDNRAWESSASRTVTKSGVALGKSWDVTADLTGVGNLGARIVSLEIDGGAPISTTYVGIKPKRAGQTGTWASIIYGADFDDDLSADTTQSGATTSDYLSTTFATSEAMTLRAQSYFTDWGTTDGSSAPDWRTQQGMYRLGYVYDHSNNSTQVAVRFKLRIGNHTVYDSGVVYPQSGDTNTHLEFLPGEVNIGYPEYTFDYMAIDAAGAPSLGMLYYAERLAGAGSFYMLRMYLIPAEHFARAGFSSLTGNARIDTTSRHKVIAFQGDSSTGFDSSYTLDEDKNWYYPRRGGWLTILPTAAGAYTYNLSFTVRDTHGLHNV